ncbi:MAG: CRISPR system precrRNA processing endoribonuclease RAMP protein Cas6 [Desulfuromonadaceae bacterium]|nr:CRISPR system precrRNA processing endoribonuclease RAMP protein Cas6 [Desulfuromonadaceae bacterium]
MPSQLPDYLNSVEFMRLHITLEFEEDIELTLADLLSLRRELLDAARSLDKQFGGDFTHLLTPHLGTDPAAIRRFQKPSPPLVLEIDPEMVGDYVAGDQLQLGFLLLGNAITEAQSLLRVLARLGEIGLHKGGGRYELIAVDSLRPDGTASPVWAEGQPWDKLEFLVDPFSWWFEAQRLDALTFEFITPARLVSGGKPLFRPTFKTLFPFILRRVGSQLSAYCFIEIHDINSLLDVAAQVRVEDNRLLWKDWKLFAAREKNRDLGGFMGSLTCSGSPLNDLLWVLRLGELFNVGKNAAWGAGRFKLNFSG